MIKAMEQIDKYSYPLNLCSGKETSINQIAQVIESKWVNNAGIFYKDLNLTLGPARKVMKINWEFKPMITFEQGVKETINAIR